MILMVSVCRFSSIFSLSVGAVIPDDISIIKMWEDERFVHSF